MIRKGIGVPWTYYEEYRTVWIISTDSAGKNVWKQRSGKKAHFLAQEPDAKVVRVYKTKLFGAAINKIRIAGFVER